MTSITVRDVPDEARDALAARARRSGRSLQEYLRAELIALSSRPDAAELAARVQARKDDDSRAEVSMADIVAHRDADRR